MRDSAKYHLRRQVLELRSELRGYMKELETIERERDRVKNSISQTVNEIRDIQEDCGDPIEIDPTHPELK